MVRHPPRRLAHPMSGRSTNEDLVCVARTRRAGLRLGVTDRIWNGAIESPKLSVFAGDDDLAQGKPWASSPANTSRFVLGWAFLTSRCNCLPINRSQECLFLNPAYERRAICAEYTLRARESIAVSRFLGGWLTAWQGSVWGNKRMHRPLTRIVGHETTDAPVISSKRGLCRLPQTALAPSPTGTVRPPRQAPFHHPGLSLRDHTLKSSQVCAAADQDLGTMCHRDASSIAGPNKPLLLRLEPRARGMRCNQSCARSRLFLSRRLSPC